MQHVRRRRSRRRCARRWRASAAVGAATVAEATGSVAAARCARSGATASTTTRVPASLAAHAVEPGDAGYARRAVHLHARRVARARAPARRRGGGRRGGRLRPREPRRAARRPQRRPRHQRPVDERRRHRHRPRPARRDRGARRGGPAACASAGRPLEGRRRVARAARLGAELGRLRRGRRRRPRHGGRHRVARARARAHHRPPARGRAGARRRLASCARMPTQNPDLFWAVRGAGANFGIVTAFEFEVDEVGDVGFAQLAFDASDTDGFLQAWGDWVVDAPRDLTSFLILGGARPGEPRVAQVMAVVDSDDPETVLDRLQPLADAAPLVGAGRAHHELSRGHLERPTTPRTRPRASRRRARGSSTTSRPSSPATRRGSSTAGRRTSSSCARSAAPCTTCPRTPPRTRTARRSSSVVGVRVEPAAHVGAVARAHRAAPRRRCT